jgi:hypothetical protein
MREVIEEHTLPLEDMNAGMNEAVWLIKMLNTVRETYRTNGSE